MASLYLWLKFIHVLAGFFFLLGHGVAVFLSFRLKQEKEAERIKAMLDLSATTWPVMMLSLLVLLVAGIITAFMGRWWGTGWVWASLVILLGQAVWMFAAGGPSYHSIRRMLGQPYNVHGNWKAPEPPRPLEEVLAAIAKTRPMEMLVIGLGGFVAIVWLMMFKPF